MIEIEVPAVSSGHTPLYFEDTTPQQRKEFGNTITNLLKEGHAIFLVEGKDSWLIRGYDPEANEFILFATRKPIPKDPKTLDQAGKEVPFERTRVSASGKKVTAVPPSQGG